LDLGHILFTPKSREKRRLGEVSPEWAWKRKKNYDLVCYPLRLIPGKDGTDRFNPLVGTSLQDFHLLFLLENGNGPRP